MRTLLLIILSIYLVKCQQTKSQIHKKVDEYIQLYQERSDFNAFLALYANDLVLEDMVGGYRVEGRESFAEFFNWPDERFEKISDETIQVKNVIVEGNRASIEGYFTPFGWNGNEVEAMQFVTILYFNDEGKIIRHIDWINYPNTLIDYSKRENSNEWID